MISDHDRDRVMQATDLLKLAGQYVKLRRSGKEYFALCPFHKEDTASFTVNPDKQKYLCRGCGASGDAIGFVMAIERLFYPDAVRLLAARAGVTLEDRQANPAVASIAAEAQWFWEHFRYRATQRQANKVILRNAAARFLSTTDSEEAFWSCMEVYRFYARSASRWDQIITRIDSASRGALLARYMAHRTRHPSIVTAYQKAQALDSACAAVEARAVSAVAKADVNGLVELIAARLSRS